MTLMKLRLALANFKVSSYALSKSNVPFIPNKTLLYVKYTHINLHVQRQILETYVQRKIEQTLI